MSLSNDKPAVSHESLLAKELSDYRPRRTRRYAAINVLLLSWEDDDIGVADEISALGDMFRHDFNYAVWPYKIPSQDAETSLNLTIARFVSSFGREDSLIVVYYGGHGGPKVATKSPCTWAAQIVGGPSLDWSVIQPQLTALASCDVVILLDCCYAGQAARGRTSRYVELLAATDKDQMTSTGNHKWPSFTKVLLAEMKAMLSRDGLVVLPALHSRVVEESAGLLRQPFYVCLSGRDGSAGSIKLSKFGESVSASNPSASLGSVCLRLSLVDSFDVDASAALVKWLTRDSPSSIRDIQLVDQALSDAQEARNLCEYLVPSGRKCQSLTRSATGQVPPPIRSDRGQQETKRMEGELPRALSRVLLGGLMPSSTPTIDGILSAVNQATANLVSFVTDSLGDLNSATAQTLQQHHQQTTSTNQTSSNPIMDDLRSRISMRLALLSNNPPSAPISVSFSDTPSKQQRLRIGKSSDTPVIVEYVYYDESEQQENAQKHLWHQANRILALHSEPKTPFFRSLHGIGLLRETLCGPRYGFVYSLPSHLAGTKPLKFTLLSDLLAQLKAVPLEARIATARALCDAVLHLHSIGWYHKNLRSANVLIFGTSETEVESKGEEQRNKENSTNWDLTNPYLIGFDCSRPSDAETRNTVDFSIKDNIYRHPERWGRSARFDKRHDLYALGIILLELGCWRMLPNMDAKRRGFQDVRDPGVFHDFLLKTAAEKLPHAAGTRYSWAAMACLAKAHPQIEGEEGWRWQKMVRETVLECLDVGPVST